MGVVVVVVGVVVPEKIHISFVSGDFKIFIFKFLPVVVEVVETQSDFGTGMATALSLATFNF